MRPPGTQINTPAWVFFMSWYANFGFGGWRQVSLVRVCLNDLDAYIKFELREMGEVRGPRLQFGTPAAPFTRLLASHICVPDHTGWRAQAGRVGRDLAPPAPPVLEVSGGVREIHSQTVLC